MVRNHLVDTISSKTFSDLSGSLQRRRLEAATQFYLRITRTIGRTQHRVGELPLTPTFVYMKAEQYRANCYGLTVPARER